MKDALLLNADYTPLKVLGWQRAIWLLMTDRVQRVDDYRGLLVRSERLSLPVPAVVALGRYAPVGDGVVALSRNAVHARDGYTCQYCGVSETWVPGRARFDLLTVDHVVPRAQSRDGRVRLADGSMAALDSWENLVTCCKGCNVRKGAKTPEEAGMALARTPKRPSAREAVRIAFSRVPVQDEWLPYLPKGTGELAA